MDQAEEVSLCLSFVKCCVCGSEDAIPVGLGTDFEYHTSQDTFLAMKCNECGLVYLNPRPSVKDFKIIYPPTYHAFNFSKKKFGFIFAVRSWLEAKRLLSWCKDLPKNARILDVGCGDGFHLWLLQKYGEKTWELEGVDTSQKAVDAAAMKGLKVHLGTIEEAGLKQGSYDLVFMLQTIEHVEKPDEIISSIYKYLKPNGRFVVVTDNTDSIDFKIFKGSYWGGYHFPRHWNLFNRENLIKLALNKKFVVEDFKTAVSPVNWVYSLHNLLVDLNSPNWLINRFTLNSFTSLTFFTFIDFILQKFRRGALLRLILKKPV